MNRPVHMSIRDDLRMRLNTGEWNAGERLPSETELAARYGVARMTVRQAVGALASEGVVVRRQGLGTFAADRRPTRSSADLLLSFTEEMRRQGHQVQTKLIGAAVEQPPPAAREALQLGQSAAAVSVRRVRLVDACPIVVQHSWLPYARFAGLDANPLQDGSLYAMLETNYGVRIVRAKQAFAAGPADESDAAALGLRPEEAVLKIARTTYDSSGLAVEYAISAMRPGYSIETVMERRPEPAARQPRRFSNGTDEDAAVSAVPSR
jgi:GntR family transcriptional regulator